MLNRIVDIYPDFEEDSVNRYPQWWGRMVVKNIQLDVIGTNINLEGNLLFEAGRYTDSAGDRELSADIGSVANNQNFKNKKAVA